MGAAHISLYLLNFHKVGTDEIRLQLVLIRRSVVEGTGMAWFAFHADVLIALALETA